MAVNFFGGWHSSDRPCLPPKASRPLRGDGRPAGATDRSRRAVPVEAHPGHAIEDGFRLLPGGAYRAVGIHSIRNRNVPPAWPGIKPVEQGGAGAADMQHAGRRGARNAGQVFCDMGQHLEQPPPLANPSLGRRSPPAAGATVNTSRPKSAIWRLRTPPLGWPEALRNCRMFTRRQLGTSPGHRRAQTASSRMRASPPAALASRAKNFQESPLAWDPA